MKLIFAIVQNDDSKRLIRELVKHHISVTRISSTGGFLHGGAPGLSKIAGQAAAPAHFRMPRSGAVHTELEVRVWTVS